MKDPTFAQKLRYKFDNSLSGGTFSLIAWLAVVSLVVIVISGLVLLVTGLSGGDPYNLPEAVWQSLMRSIDSGAVAGDEGWAFRIWMLIITVFGIFIFSALIGVLTSGLEAKMEELQKGKSLVIESGHTLILGWSPRIFLIISELVKANENTSKPRIVVLAEKDKVEMEDEIREKVGDLKNTKVICRTGSPIDLDDLDIVNPQTSKSIIILSPDDSADPDSQVIKMILALTNSPNRRKAPYHIVAEIRDTENAQVAHMIGKDEVELVLINDLISRITAQTCRQTGLSVVYQDLLDYDGDDVYFTNQPSLVGTKYGDAIGRFRKSALMGIAVKDGRVMLNPSMDRVIEAGEQLVVVAEDDGDISIDSAQKIDESLIVKPTPSFGDQEKLLILGWNARGNKITEELDHYVSSGSSLLVVSEFAETEEEIAILRPRLKNLDVEFRIGRTSDRRLLDMLDLISFKHIILLCYSDNYDVNEADSKTLVTLLHLRDIESKKGDSYSVVSEMLDVKNRALAEVAKADDFIVSDELAGLLMTQISENKLLGRVFEDLFDSEGAEIYLKPIEEFVKTGEKLDFYTVAESARRQGMTAIGYRLQKFADDADKKYGIFLNPEKNADITFDSVDKLIVLAN